MMKKIVAFMFSVALAVSLAACVGEGHEDGSGGTQEAAGISETEQVQADKTDGVDELAGDSAATEETSESEKTTGSSVLIAYFTYGENAELSSDVDVSTTASIQVLNGEVTGNTGLMAHMIAEASEGDLFSIRTTKNYPDNYNDTIDVGQEEKENGTHPELATHIENLEQYDTVFVGFPNWWYGMPMVMYSFFDEYDFGGKTIIPFCTSGGSAFSDAIDEIKNLEPDAEVLDGLHIGGSSISSAESKVNEWVSGLGLSK